MNLKKTALKIFIILLCLSCIGLIQKNQVQAGTGSVAFIYYDDLTTATAFKTLLATQGITVDLVTNASAATLDYSTYKLIIIGHDTRSGSWNAVWQPTAAVTAIQASGKPVLGIYYGGSTFFRTLGLNTIIAGNTAGTADTFVNVIDSSHTVFNSPIKITVPPSKNLQVSTMAVGQSIYYPSAVSGVTGIARNPTSTSYYLLIQETSRYVYWGMNNSPDQMTQTGKDLFVNTVAWLGAIATTTPTPSPTPISTPSPTPTNESESPTPMVSTPTPGTLTPSFSLTTAPATQTVTAGNETTYQITITTSGGFNNTISLSVSGLPSGATATFNPPALTSGTSTLTISTTASAAIGTSIITITGNGGGITSQTNTELQIDSGTTPPPMDLTLIVIIAAVVVVVIVVIVIVLLLKRRKPRAPTQVKITAEPTNLVANGQNQAVITLQLLDKKGKPISAMSDTRIQVNATKGTLVNPVVTIPKGKDTEKTAIVSSTETGPVPISANADGLKSITVTLNFTERSRYCMHCGTMMSIKDKACKNCGRSPPAGDDTKPCQSCQAVIPIVAKFCSECGAGQQV